MTFCIELTLLNRIIIQCKKQCRCFLADNKVNNKIKVHDWNFYFFYINFPLDIEIGSVFMLNYINYKGGGICRSKLQIIYVI